MTKGLSALRPIVAIALVLASIGAVGCGREALRPPIAAPPLLPCTRPDCLRVVSWNVHAIPLISPRPTARLQNIATKIREQQPDLVLLQEVWAYSFVRRLATGLAGQYRVTTAAGCRRPFPCGGLVVLVRIGSGWVASPPTFVPFAATAPWYRLFEWDGLAGKGTLLLELARGGTTLGVVDTHLQTEYTRYGRDYSDIRRRQLEQLASTLDTTFDGRAVVVGGDFNTGAKEQSGLYTSHVACLGDDRTAAFRATCGECGTRPPPLNPARWIDYVITRGFAATSDLALLTNDAVDRPFSDHDGLLVRFVGPGVGAGTSGVDGEAPGVDGEAPGLDGEAMAPK